MRKSKQPFLNSYLEKQQRNLRRSRRTPLPEPASITNLIANAIKFTERGSFIVHLSKETESETLVVVRFEIEDAGIGIQPENQE